MPSFENAILKSLSDVDASHLTAGSSRVDLPFGETIYAVGDEVGWVYFPEGCLLSSVRYTLDGHLTESGMTGYESAVGFVEACGSRKSNASVLVQVDGPAWRIPAESCRSLVANGGPVVTILFAVLELQLIEARQSSLCRSFHSAEARLARWLLESRDRSEVRQTLPVTQEFLAAMLGVRRTTVTAFAGELQQRGLIRYSRGRVEFLDVEGLEDAACECRHLLLRERARVDIGAKFLPGEPQILV